MNYTIFFLLIALLIFIGYRSVVSANGDLVRARAWGEVARRMLPFGGILLMAATLPLIQNPPADWVPLTWAVAMGALILLCNIFSIPSGERKAARAFRKGRYEEAERLYERLGREKPLARYHAFRGAALAAAERHEEALQATSRAIEMDPEYGIAYYNRAMNYRKMGRKRSALADFKKALEVDLPRRFRKVSRQAIEELS
ncbi:tetratricopeptide repeat protein [Rubrobacter taiwanensis]|jgi:tetratricopeptide (TPR) repeat protein|uniref:Tetratricopeptide repeat protein n=1 Tax=Rubrobacter taiwanensis TaxID=185139 RepID=A0A4V2NW52_9ACTN|nr:tetratricopeptide repeat protein [Rubrobacter taiwanensis]TCJ16052.1 tetratricopeptide repeat protein [Rubrobacter taiwanensis]